MPFPLGGTEASLSDTFQQSGGCSTPGYSWHSMHIVTTVWHPVQRHVCGLLMRCLSSISLGGCSREWVPVQAKRELVESYKRLRTEDAAPGSSTSYRYA